MTQREDARTGHTDPVILALLVGLVSLAALPALAGGLVLFGLWRLLQLRTPRHWSWLALSAVLAVLVTGAGAHFTRAPVIERYLSGQAGLLEAGFGVLRGQGGRTWELTTYLGDVASLAAPGAFLIALTLELWLRTRRPLLGQREADGINVPARVERRAEQGIDHPGVGWAVGYRADGRAVCVSDDEARHHVLVCGATGSGKTTLIRLLVEAVADRCPVVIVDGKASRALRQAVEELPHGRVWSIGGPLRWDALRGDPTSLANKLLAAERYSFAAEIYRAAAERYLQWLGLVLELTGQPRHPDLVAELLVPAALARQLRGLRDGPSREVAERLAQRVADLGATEQEGIAGFAARYGMLVEGIAGRSLGVGQGSLVLEDAIGAGQTVLFSLDAATYPHLAAKLGAWVLLDLVRVSALIQTDGSAGEPPCYVIIDEFSALGPEGRHVVPVLARTREAGMACLLATQGLADLARVNPPLPQQVVQNTAARVVLRQGSAEDAEAWERILGMYELEDLSRWVVGAGGRGGTGYALGARIPVASR